MSYSERRGGRQSMRSSLASVESFTLYCDSMDILMSADSAVPRLESIASLNSLEMKPGYNQEVFLPEFVDPRTVAGYALPLDNDVSTYPSPVSGPTTSPTHLDQTETLSYLDNTPAVPTWSGQFQNPFLNTPNLSQFNPSYSESPKVKFESPKTFPSPISPKASSKPIAFSPPQSPPLRRRGPGRPSKSHHTIQVSQPKRPTGHTAVKLRRQMHNDSAMRSRARLNQTLDELWQCIPKQERTLQHGFGDGDLDDGREVCRAIKVEVAISYLRKLQGLVTEGVDV